MLSASLNVEGWGFDVGFPPLGLEPLDEFARLCWLVREVMHIA